MQNKRYSAPRPARQMAVWKVALIDFGLLVVCLLVFALFDHVIPRSIQAVSEPLETATPMPTPASTPVPEAAEAVADATLAPTSTPEPEVGDFSARFPGKFTDGEIIQTENSYQSPNINLTVNRYEAMVGNYKEVYYVADIYIRNIKCLRTLFAKDNFGRSVNEDVVKMSARAGALVAINADYYSFRSEGTVIRNGVMYRDGIFPGMDVCVLYKDGTMKAFSTEAEFDINREMANGAWQGFNFGPALLDGNGNLLPKYEDVNHDPRTLIGMVEPGHYVFIVIDGRQKGYSAGMEYEECAILCREMGCMFAYNLDGGETSQMTYMGEMYNHPYQDGRDTSDIIYIAEPRT